jgi:hypothetical protein
MILTWSTLPRLRISSLRSIAVFPVTQCDDQEQSHSGEHRDHRFLLASFADQAAAG